MIAHQDGLRPFFTLYGGKWRSAPFYPKPDSETIIEPFAGSAGYSLRYPDRNIVLVEKDPVIATTWRYLINVSPSEIMALPDIMMDQHVDDLHVCEEAKMLIGWWLNKGTSRPRMSPSSWMRSGINASSFWGNKIKERIASQLDRIRHWVVIDGNYHFAPNVDAMWFIDPPYQIAGNMYRCGSKTIDYKYLSEWCQSRLSRVIVCENTGADWLDFKPWRIVKSNPSKRGKGFSNECIWTKGIND